MVQKKKQTTRKTSAKASSKTEMRRVPTTTDDFKTAALLVSATINVGIFVGWLAIKLTTEYDIQVAQFLFSR